MRFLLNFGDSGRVGGQDLDGLKNECDIKGTINQLSNKLADSASFRYIKKLRRKVSQHISVNQRTNEALVVTLLQVPLCYADDNMVL